MARTPVKRRSRNTHSVAQLQKRHAPSGETHVLQRLRERKTRRNVGVGKSYKSIANESSQTNGTTARQGRSGENPAASFLGLPTELRLQIYAYLSETTLIHVHSKRAYTYTWTPCKTANPNHPLLCLNPKWSGLCPEDQRCTFKHAAPPEPLGFWGLIATSKFIRQETQEYLMKDSVFAIHPLKVRRWLQWLKKHAPKQLNSIRKVTLTGPDHPAHFPSYVLPELKKKLPNLTAVGYQCQMPRYWCLSDEQLANPEIDPTSPQFRWNVARWNIVQWVRIFGPKVTVVIEGLVWIRKQRIKDPVSNARIQIKERQGIVRVIRERKDDEYVGTGWEFDNMKLEVEQPGALVAGKRNAEWRIWWAADELKSFG